MFWSLDFVIHLKTCCWHVYFVYTSMTIFYLFQSVLNALRLQQSVPRTKEARSKCPTFDKVCSNPLVLVRVQTCVLVLTLYRVIMYIVFIFMISCINKFSCFQVWVAGAGWRAVEWPQSALSSLDSRERSLKRGRPQYTCTVQTSVAMETNTA